MRDGKEVFMNYLDKSREREVQENDTYLGR